MMLGVLGMWVACTPGNEPDLDSEVVETDEAELEVPVGEYNLAPYLRWPIAESDDGNVMVLTMDLEVAADGTFTGTLSNLWTVDEIEVNATCDHALSGVVEDGGGEVEFSLIVSEIQDPVCDVTPSGQSAWTDAMRTNFLWFGWIPLEYIADDWDQQGQSINDLIAFQANLGMDITHVAVVTTGDYFLVDPDVQPYAFFGSVERLPEAE